MRNALFQTLFLMTAGLFIAGCQTEPKTAEEQDQLRDEAQSGLKEFERDDSSLRALLDRAYGYAIFPSVGKGGVIAGGAYGRGGVYERGQFIGYADLTQATLGLQLGGQTYSELIVFENREALDKFKTGKFSFEANASAVAIKAGAAAAAQFKNGVAVFVKPKGGLMFEASIGGQEFSFKPADAAHTTSAGRTP